MNVTELITTLSALDPGTPVSHELLAELAPVDDEAIYGRGRSKFHPSIFAFRKQRFQRAAAAAKRAIQKLREAGWDARVTRRSIGDGTRFVDHISFVLFSIGTCPDRPWGSVSELERLVRDEMADWEYHVDNGSFIKREAHQAKFDDALSLDEIEATLRKNADALSPEILRFADISATTKSYLLSRGPILYMDEVRFPAEIVREWPDGRREIVRRDASGELVVVRAITNESSK